MISKKGFTLLEMLVVIAVLSVASTLILTIFTRTLKGGNKIQIIETIKQNGQSVIEGMDKNIRNSDRVVCVSEIDNTIVVVKNGLYTKYQFFAPRKSTNGYIQQDSFSLPSTPPSGSDDFYIKNFEIDLCTDIQYNPKILTDTDLKTGVSVECIALDCTANPFFTRDRSAGFKDTVTVKFNVTSGKLAPASVTGQIDPVTFQTTINLR